MKKRTINKLLAAGLAFAMVFGFAMSPAITAKADYVAPGGAPASPGGMDVSVDDGSSSDSGETTEDLGRTEGNQFNSGSSNGSSGSSEDNSAGSYNGGSSGGSDSYSGGSAGDGNGGGNSQTSTAAALVCSGKTMNVPGYETWRPQASAAAGTFSVYHCGIEQYTVQLKDQDGRAASYKRAGLCQAEDGRYYINIETAAGVDTAGWVISTAKGTAGYLPRLGVSGVCLNGTAVVDAEAVAAAAAN